MAVVCLLVPILLLAALIGLGRYEDFVLRSGAPNARGRPPDGAVPVTGWPETPAFDGGPGAAVAQPGIE